MFRFSRDNEDVVEVKVTTETFIKLGLFLLAISAFMLFFRRAEHAIFLIAFSVFLALALNYPVHFISSKIPGKHKGSRAIGTAVSYLFVILVIGGFIALLAPALTRNTNKFIGQSPHIINEFKNQSGAVGDFVRKYHLSGQLTTVSNQLSDRVHNIGGTAFKTVTGIGSSVFSVLTVLVLTFMMLVEGPKWVKFVNSIVPGKNQSMVSRVSADMYSVIKGFVNGQVLLALIATVLIAPALFILHISYPIALIMVIFICALIPMIGHTIGAIIIGLVALTHSVSSAAIILIYYILYLQFENYVIQPKVQANSTNMSPLLVFSAVVIGVSFGGILGGLVAIPIAGCIRIVILEYLRTKGIIDQKQFIESTSPKSNTTE